MKEIAVFCGSACGAHPAYAEKAQELGTLMAQRGYGLVYGAGNVGLMGVLADAALSAGGKVTGVIPQRLVDVEVCHTKLTDTHVVESMSERKVLIEKLSDAFIILPGGYGTLDEFFEMLTLTQLSVIKKPIGILNVRGYFDKMFEMIEHFSNERFIRPVHRDLFFSSTQPGELLETLSRFMPAETSKWLVDFKINKY